MSMNPRLLKPTASGFSPRSISGLALWLDASSSDLYTTDAGPVAAVASPLDIAGCALWLDANDATSITASGGNVTAWADKSASALSFTAAGTPVTGSATLNGRNVIRFDNVADLLSATSATRLGVTSSYTVFTVARYTTVQTSMLMSIGRSNSPLSGFTLYYNGGLRTIEKRDAAWGTDMVVSGSIATANVALLATCTRSGTDQRIMRDGVLAGSTAGSTGDIFWNTTSVLIGNTFEGTFLGDIAEIILYPTALTTADRARVEAYLAAKWSISGVHAPATATSDPVGYWGDKSGNGRHAVQATAGSRPLVGSIASGRGLVFDSNDSLLSLASMADITGAPASSPATTIAFIALNSSGAAGFTMGANDAANGRLLVSNSFDAAGASFFDVAGTSGGRLSYTLPASSQTTASVYIMQRNGASMIVRRNGATIATKADASQTYSATTARLALGQAVGLSGFAGTCASVLCYPSALTATQYQRLEQYLATRWGITLAPQVANADAQNWIDRVYANGGSVSSATAAAVNQLCDSLDAASLRDRFYRLNLFCGSNLNAALVPLYRGPSLGGTQYGNATDTNVGPFVSGDFAEATGLAGGSGKYLRTGLTQTSVGLACHLAFYDCAKPTNAYANRIGSRGAGDANEHQITNVDVATTMHYGSGPVAGNGRAISTGYTQAGAFWLGINPSATSAILYKNGVSAATVAPPARTAQSVEYWLFALNNNGSIDSPMTTGRGGGYSIGLSMDATQAAAYNTAMQAFQTSLTRNA